MKNRTPKTSIYLVVTFALAWVMQYVAAWFYHHDQMTVGQLILAASMFAPFVGVLAAGGSLKGMGWKPALKGNVSSWLAAWLAPTVLTLVGALLYFAVFPSHFDLSGDYLRAAAGEAGDAALQQLKAQGITYPLYVLITSVTALTYTPFLNALFAVGEEVGWRGFLYPRLKEKCGRRAGQVLGGVIWSVWHWPLIWLIGYEYGTDYWGFPMVGMLLFCLFTVALGIFFDALYEKTRCIWLPALAHGSINAAATIPPVICAVVRPRGVALLGPAPNGLLAGLPVLIVGLVLLLRKKEV